METQTIVANPENKTNIEAGYNAPNTHQSLTNVLQTGLSTFCSVHIQEIFWNFIIYALSVVLLMLWQVCTQEIYFMEVFIWNQDYNKTGLFIIFRAFNYLSYLNDKMFTHEKSEDYRTIINLLNWFQPYVAKVKRCLSIHIINYSSSPCVVL